MSEQKKNMQAPLFTKDNLIWMLIGGVVMAIGFVLLSG